MPQNEALWFSCFLSWARYGGHCIPIDPFLLSWKAKKYNFQTKFIELSGKINEKMPKIICDKVDRILKNKKNRSCLIIGVAYKKNVDDMRESPSLQIFENLEKRKIRCDYYDPYIKEIKHVRKFNKVKKSIKLTAANIKKYDVVVLATDHDIIDYDTLKKHSSMILIVEVGIQKTIIRTYNKYEKFYNSGAGGYIAPKHLDAIKKTKNNLLAAYDVAENVGIIDSFFQDSKFFFKFNEFIKFISKNKKAIDYLVICAPNYLHFFYIKLGIKYNLNVICEKPLLLKIN